MKDPQPVHPTPINPATNTHKLHKGHHRLMMVACCLPMLAIVLVLVITGVVNASYLLLVGVCVLVMAVMMGGMRHERHDRHQD